MLKISRIVKVKMTGLYKKAYIWCVALKRVNSSPNTNVGEIYKSFNQEVNLQQLEYQGNYIYQEIISVVQEQT